MSGFEKRRGRPIGDGKDDDDTMRRMAELIDAEPTLRPTTAIRRALGYHDETVARRVRGKWRARRERFLAEVRALRHRTAPPARSIDFTSFASAADRVAMTDLASIAAGQTALRETAQKMHEVFERTELRMARELAMRPDVVLARELARTHAIEAHRVFSATEEARRMTEGVYDRLRREGWL